MFASIGTTEVLIIVLIALLLFGNKEIKQIVRTIVKVRHDINKTSQKVKNEIDQIFDDEDLSG